MGALSALLLMGGAGAAIANRTPSHEMSLEEAGFSSTNETPPPRTGDIEPPEPKKELPKLQGEKQENRDGKIWGRGRIVSPNGTIEEGRFRHGVLHGKGKRIFPTGEKQEGVFKNGQLVVNSQTPLDCSAEVILCKTGPLEKRKLANLFASYSGIRGEVPSEKEVNFYTQLEKLWDAKKVNFPGRKVVVEACDQVLSEYKTLPHDTMSLEAYTSMVDDVVTEIKAEISWDEVAKLKKMNAEEIKTAKKVINLIDGSGVLAYSLTELMPSADGELNKNVLAFLLKYAGTRFVYSIPAIADEMTSFGPYQFTSYALRDLPGDRRGASVTNQALPKDIRIPGSVIKLRGEDHHRAAFLFMINNICELVKRGSDKSGWKQLENNSPRMREQMIIFSAVAHHMPTVALRNATEWLNGGFKDELAHHLTPRLKEYAKKTKANLGAVAGMVRETKVLIETPREVALPQPPVTPKPMPSVSVPTTPTSSKPTRDDIRTLAGSVSEKREEDNAVAALKLSKFTTLQSLKDAIQRGEMVTVKDGPHYILRGVGEEDPRNASLYASLRPHTKKMVDAIAAKFYAAFGQKLTISSLSRTESYVDILRKKNANASKTSTHMYGTTLDFTKTGMSQAQLEWMRKTLAEMEQSGILVATEEWKEPCFHIVDIHANER